MRPGALITGNFPQPSHADNLKLSLQLLREPHKTITKVSNIFATAT